jgi:Nickel responsive protein SCO4226-like
VVFVVERYLPGLDRDALLRSLAHLEQAIAQMSSEGTRIRYLGSTIVPDDEACFCQFEATSATDVAEANRRARVPFDRIVDAVAAPAPVREENR